MEEAADQKYSYIICAVKCLIDVTPTSDILKPLFNLLAASPATAVVLIQNGIGIEDGLQEAFAGRGLKNPIISGCAWVDTTVTDGGKTITQHGNERLVLGYHSPPDAENFSEDTSKAALDCLCESLKLGKVSAEPAEIDVARWRKVLWCVARSRFADFVHDISRRNASFSTICTLTRATVGEVLAIPESRAALLDIMSEVLSVAHACLPGNASAAAILHATVGQDIVNNENRASVFKPSMLQDLEAKRPMEVEAIVGGIIKRAKAKGIDVPRLTFVYAGLKVVQAGLIKHREVFRLASR